MRHRPATAGLLALGLLLPLGAAACSDDDDDGGAIVAEGEGDGSSNTTDGASADTAAAITIEGFAFTDATVAAGATVEVSNADSTNHTVSSDDDDWDALQLGGGESGSFTAPDAAGTYDFHCDIHPTMTGTLTVE